MTLHETGFREVQVLTGTFLDPVMVFLAEFLVFLVPGVLVFLWLRGRNSAKESFFGFSGVVAALVISYVMGFLLSYPPPFASGFETLVSEAGASSSFPSQHTVVLFGAGSVFYRREDSFLSGLLMVAGLLTGFSRVYVGLHFPLDILGAAVAAYLGLKTVEVGEGLVEQVFQACWGVYASLLEQVGVEV